MLIANPIYDIAFKFLMEDIDLARRFLSVIINENIIELEVEPQEFVEQSDKMQLTLLRLDFKATILLADNSRKIALLELQKSKKPYDVIRFRRYLAKNYAHREPVQKVLTSGETKTAFKDPLPIITIYFFGFDLVGIDTPAMKVNREYYDLINQKVIQQKHAYIEQLTHDCFIIQIERLPDVARTKLGKALSVFNQNYIIDDGRILSVDERRMDDELQKAIANRLSLILDDDKMLKKMIVEDEYESAYEDQVRAVQEKQEQLQEKQEQLQEKQEQLKEKQEQLDKQQEMLNEQKEKLEAQERLIEELKKRLNNEAD